MTAPSLMANRLKPFKFYSSGHKNIEVYNRIKKSYSWHVSIQIELSRVFPYLSSVRRGDRGRVRDFCNLAGFGDLKVNG